MVTTRNNQTEGTISRIPSLRSLDGRDLNWLIGEFCIHQENMCAEKTLASYRARLLWFTEWWAERGPLQEWKLTTLDFSEFERHLQTAVSDKTGKPLSYTYRASTMYLLREVFHWAFRRGYIGEDYAGWVPKARGARSKRKVVSKEALDTLFNEASKKTDRTRDRYHRSRDRTILAVLIGMGLRRAEVSSMNVEEIFFQPDYSGHARVYGKRTRANPSGERDAAFDSTTGQFIAAHIEEEEYTSGPLFRNRFGERLAPLGISYLVKDMILAAGLGDEIQACHDLRRAFATHYIRDNNDPHAADILRRQLGHTSYAMTAEYTLLDVSDLEKNIVSPLANRPNNMVPMIPDRTQVLCIEALDQLISRYLADIGVRLDSRAVESHAYRLQWFIRWWAEYGPSRQWQLTKEDVRRFEQELQSTISDRTRSPLSFGYRKMILWALRAILEWTFEQGYTDADCATWVPAKPTDFIALPLANSETLPIGDTTL